MAHPIPSEFYSFETNSPFEHCIECEKYLLEDGTEYLVEKAIRNYDGFTAKDVVFDYAICMDCAETMHKQISTESMNTMMRYFTENMDVEERLAMKLEGPEQCIRQCMFKKIKSEDCKDYQLIAHCNGMTLSMENPPYLISGQVIEELMPLLSEQTLGEMDGFFHKHFSPDPSFFEPTPRLLLV